MFTKYRIVKVKFSSGREYFAYEQTFLGVFKTYLNIATDCDTWYGPSDLEEERSWLLVDTVDEVKEGIQKLNKPKMTITITDAETRLERHLGGIE